MHPLIEEKSVFKSFALFGMHLLICFKIVCEGILLLQRAFPRMKVYYCSAKAHWDELSPADLSACVNQDSFDIKREPLLFYIFADPYCVTESIISLQIL